MAKKLLKHQIEAAGLPVQSAVEVKNTGAVGNTGETIQFGKWSWLVLERRDNMALIIAENIIEKRDFDTAPVSMWEGSSLQKYLNNEFLQTHFTAEEREQILYVENGSADNPPNQWYNENTIAAKSGKDIKGLVYNVSHIGKSERRSKNHIFLLSLDEVCRYFGDSLEKLNNGNYRIDGWDYIPLRDGVPAQNTLLDGEGLWWFSDEHDQNRVAIDLESNRACAWWLRSGGIMRSRRAAVYPDGSVSMIGGNGGEKHGTGRVKRWGVRPALWLRTGEGPVEEEYVDPDVQAVPEAPAIAADVIPIAADLIGKWGSGGELTVEVVNDTTMMFFGNAYNVEFSGNTIKIKGIGGNVLPVDLGSVKFLMNAEKNAVQWSDGTVTFMGWNGQTWHKME